MNRQTTISDKTAKIVSLVGHPFVLLALTVTLAATERETAARALTISAVTIAATVLPLLLIIRRRVAAGKWSDHDVSDATERRGFYPIVMAVVAASLIVFYLLDFPRPLLAGTAVGLLLSAAAMLINRRSKISLHLSFAVYFAVSLSAINVWGGALMLALAAGVGWSRVALGRHTTAQVVSGAALGAAAGLFLLRALGFFA
jgi:membrane-associated phospholipid phosphatase